MADIPDAALLSAFQAQAADWPLTGQDAADAAPITIQRDADGFRFLSPTYDVVDFVFPPGLVAGNGLIGCLIHTFVAGSPDWICLHAGAVETEGGLTVLLGDTLAGKSTMSVAVMALGHRLWTDDRLPVSGTADFQAMSLALRPKLRLPLPPNAPDAFRSFVEDRVGPREGDMIYVMARPGESARFDARAGIRRLVVLNRIEGATCSIAPSPLGATVKRLVTTCFAPHLGPIGLLERARALAESTECVSLTYEDTFEAAEALSQWSLT